jgi:Rieske Fe-S protein
MRRIDTIPSDTTLARRQVLGASVAGATLLVLPEACGGNGSSTDVEAGPRKDAALEASPKDAAEEPKPTLVDGGGDCKQDDWTRPISIMKTGIALKGTAYAFTDARFSDLVFGQDRILVINPLTGSGYVAMSGVCTHNGCSPEYFVKCKYATSGLNEGRCTAAPVETGSDGGTDGDTDAPTESGAATDGGADAVAESGADTGPDGTADARADKDSESEVEASSEAGDASDAGDADEEGGATELLTDVLWCPCHNSVYDALTGVALSGPATQTGNLQILKTCIGGGDVFVTIPQNPPPTGG